MLTQRANKMLSQLPTSFENYADVLSQLGYRVTLNFKALFPTCESNINALPQAITTQQDSGIWIGIAPFAAHKNKIYPLERMETVIEKLQNEYPDSRIFLFGGGQNEIRKLDDITQRHKHCTSVPHFLHGFKQELALMSRLDAMISMDSANMHLASLVAVPVISIWGATHPLAGFMGWNQSQENVVQTELACRPCSIFGNKPCFRGDLACMTAIEPDEIVRRVKSVLENKRRA